MGAEPGDLIGRTIVVTGASSGIGAAAARALAARGATVVAVGRDPDRTAAIGAEVGVEPIVADLADFEQVRQLASTISARFDRVDVLALNAGGMHSDLSITADGFERTFQTNYLAPFLLQTLLHDQLIESRSRVVVTSSSAHRLGRLDLETLGEPAQRYSGFRAYSDSKLALTLFARELHARFGAAGVRVASFHPGLVRTGFADAAPGSFGARQQAVFGRILPILEPEQGAAPLVHLATTPDATLLDGRYVSRMRPDARGSGRARNPRLARALWERTEALLAAPFAAT